MLSPEIIKQQDRQLCEIGLQNDTLEMRCDKNMVSPEIFKYQDTAQQKNLVQNNDGLKQQQSREEFCRFEEEKQQEENGVNASMKNKCLPQDHYHPNQDQSNFILDQQSGTGQQSTNFENIYSQNTCQNPTVKNGGGNGAVDFYEQPQNLHAQQQNDFMEISTEKKLVENFQHNENILGKQDVNTLNNHSNNIFQQTLDQSSLQKNNGNLLKDECGPMWEKSGSQNNGFKGGGFQDSEEQDEFGDIGGVNQCARIEVVE
eukprot:TRINITY_DN14016_c0_g1_i1.p1 TRINITY_DN14016_c0_g1~~TRINITY_DN14016_c0_g1_i1.p1  ORF type:complete len:259 (+),score=44.32 TRINITY_DN14016_c0_g1_i1:326-1102(+)